MLGRLAKWLRLLGYDTVYAGQETDHQIAAQARAQSRIVLTRDRELARRRGIQCLLIDSEVLEQQLHEVVATYGLPVPGFTPRCPQCNALLESIDREVARPHVPPYVYQTHHHFHRCEPCSRYYWPGSHWQRIKETLTLIREGVKSRPGTLA